MSKDHPKPVENGELRATAHKLYLCAIGKYSGKPEDNVLAELEALLAQEKAKWDTELIAEFEKLLEEVGRTSYKSPVYNHIENKVAKLRAKLLDKENV